MIIHGELCVPSLQWLLEGGALPPLQAQLTDADAAARAAAKIPDNFPG